MVAETGVDAGRAAAALDARLAESRERLEARRMRALAAMRDALPSAGAALPAVRQLYLFGSVLIPGAFRSDSDVDIGVDGDLSADEFFALWREIDAAAPGWETDLVELARARVHFAERVREEGELVYAAGNPDAQG